MENPNSNNLLLPAIVCELYDEIISRNEIKRASEI